MDSAKHVDRSSAGVGWETPLFNFNRKSSPIKVTQEPHIQCYNTLPQDKAASKYFKNNNSYVQHGIEFLLQHESFLNNILAIYQAVQKKRCVYNTIRYVEQPVESPESLLTVFLGLSDILLEYFFTLGHLLQKSHHINDTKKASVSSNPSDLQTSHWTIYDCPKLQ